MSRRSLRFKPKTSQRNKMGKSDHAEGGIEKEIKMDIAESKSKGAEPHSNVLSDCDDRTVAQDSCTAEDVAMSELVSHSDDKSSAPEISLSSAQLPFPPADPHFPAQNSCTAGDGTMSELVCRLDSKSLAAETASSSEQFSFPPAEPDLADIPTEDLDVIKRCIRMYPKHIIRLLREIHPAEISLPLAMQSEKMKQEAMDVTQNDGVCNTRPSKKIRINIDQTMASKIKPLFLNSASDIERVTTSVSESEFDFVEADSRDVHTMKKYLFHNAGKKNRRFQLRIKRRQMDCLLPLYPRQILRILQQLGIVGTVEKLETIAARGPNVPENDTHAESSSVPRDILPHDFIIEQVPEINQQVEKDLAKKILPKVVQMEINMPPEKKICINIDKELASKIKPLEPESGRCREAGSGVESAATPVSSTESEPDFVEITAWDLTAMRMYVESNAGKKNARHFQLYLKRLQKKCQVRLSPKQVLQMLEQLGPVVEKAVEMSETTSSDKQNFPENNKHAGMSFVSEDIIPCASNSQQVTDKIHPITRAAAAAEPLPTININDKQSEQSGRFIIDKALSLKIKPLSVQAVSSMPPILSVEVEPNVVEIQPAELDVLKKFASIHRGKHIRKCLLFKFKRLSGDYCKVNLYPKHILRQLSFAEQNAVKKSDATAKVDKDNHGNDRKAATSFIPETVLPHASNSECDAAKNQKVRQDPAENIFPHASHVEQAPKTIPAARIASVNNELPQKQGFPKVVVGEPFHTVMSQFHWKESIRIDIDLELFSTITPLSSHVPVSVAEHPPCVKIALADLDAMRTFASLKLEPGSSRTFQLKLKRLNRDFKMVLYQKHVVQMIKMIHRTASRAPHR